MGITIHNFHPVTREYIGSGEADESPLEPGEFIIPANSTNVAPPLIGKYEAAVFDLDVEAWSIVPDFRSVALYSTVDGSLVLVTDIGQQPENTTTQPPPSQMHDWSGTAWVLNSKKAKAAQCDVINAACENAIAAIQASYPASEVLSWPKQETEARAYAADPGAATPLLDALAEGRGIDKAELARRVILKADAFAQYSGAVIGKRQGLEDALNALPADATVEQIAAISW